MKMSDYGEPWRLDQGQYYLGGRLRRYRRLLAVNGDILVNVPAYALLPVARALACVNACAGARTEDLEEVVAARATVAFPTADTYKRLAVAERLLQVHGRCIVCHGAYTGSYRHCERCQDSGLEPEVREFLAKERIDA